MADGEPRPKIAFLMDGFSPYRVPFWKELSVYCDLDVVLLKGVEKGRSWVPESSAEYRTHILDSKQIYIKSLDWALNLSVMKVWTLLNKINPQVVIIGGWASPGYWVARNWALHNRRQMILWMESNTLSSRTQANIAINAIKRHFVSRFDGYYVFGKFGVEYLAAFGAPKPKIVSAFNLPDIDCFKSSEKIEDIENGPKLLYAGQLIARKGVMLIPEGLSRLTHLPWHIFVAGSGDLRGDLDVSFRKEGIIERVTFLGELTPKELALLYRRCDILLFPSINEVWGMVVHEALLSGMFVVGTDRSAACHALIQERVSGTLFCPSSSDSFSRAVDQAISGHPHNRNLIRKSVESISMASEVSKLWGLIR